MQIQQTPLKPLNSLQLTPEEATLLKWLRGVKWEMVKGPHDAVSYKAKVPEFYNGARLYRVQGGSAPGSLGALELFIKKLGFQGIISKQELYPIIGQGSQPRYLSLKKVDLDNLGVGKDDEDEE